MNALRTLVVWFLSTFFSLLLSAQSHTVRIDTPGIVMLIDERLHTELPGIAPMSASETIIVQGREIRDFRLQSHQSRKINDKFGSGRQEIVSADGVGLRKELTITSYEQFPGVLVFSARYTNTAASQVSIEGWTNHHYSVLSNGGEPAFWSFQSGSYSKRPDWVLPLKEGFHQENFQGMNAIDYGGGTPVTDVWRRDGGLAIGHLDSSRNSFHFRLRCPMPPMPKSESITKWPAGLRPATASIRCEHLCRSTKAITSQRSRVIER